MTKSFLLVVVEGQSRVKRSIDHLVNDSKTASWVDLLAEDYSRAGGAGQAAPVGRGDVPCTSADVSGSKIVLISLSINVCLE